MKFYGLHSNIPKSNSPLYLNCEHPSLQLMWLVFVRVLPTLSIYLLKKISSNVF